MVEAAVSLRDRSLAASAFGTDGETDEIIEPRRRTCGEPYIPIIRAL
jgi:hypothetical protein